jgi:hypothetical protein
VLCVASLRKRITQLFTTIWKHSYVKLGVDNNALIDVVTICRFRESFEVEVTTVGASLSASIPRHQRLHIAGI